jgi:hypothetical protein
MRGTGVSCKLRGAWAFVAVGAMAASLSIAGCGGAHSPSQHEREVQTIRKDVRRVRAMAERFRELHLIVDADRSLARACLAKHEVRCAEKDARELKKKEAAMADIARSFHRIRRDVYQHSAAAIRDAKQAELEASGRN